MKSQHPNFRPPSPEIDARANKLIDGLTLEEKIKLIGGDGWGTQALDEKGIPQIRFADGPVGVHWWTEKSTAYPALVALAASWNADLSRAMGDALARDCRARGVHVLLAPGVNLYRSPLCGRNFEYMGEDPWLAAQMAKDYIEGLQDQGVAAVIKHFAGNFQEYARHEISTDADARTWRELYFKAFEVAVKEAGVASVMCSYNLINGQHASENHWLNVEVLREEWDFAGLLMSDWGSTYDAIGALNNGLDLEMPLGRKINNESVLQAIANGTVTEAMLDEKIRRLLRMALCFGWFDHEQRDESIPQPDPATEQVALEVAREGIVLLKNEPTLLPLDKQAVKKVCVLGLHADVALTGGGGSSYTPAFSEITPLEGLRKLTPEVEFVHHQAVNPYNFEQVFADCAFGGEGLKAEFFNNRDLKGEPDLVRTDERINFPWHGQEVGEGIDKGNFSVRWTGTIQAEVSGQHAFHLRTNDACLRFYLEGELLLDHSRYVAAGVNTVYAELEAGRSYAIEVQFLQRRFWNNMHFGWESLEGMKHNYEQALTDAKEADAVLVFAGFMKDTEGEGFDRPFSLNPLQEALIRNAAAANSKTAVIVQAGGGVDLSSWLEAVPALLWLWYPGQAGGQAIAEVLFGEVNPSGKLPMTFEKRLEDRSSFDCYHPDGKEERVRLKDGIFSGYRHFDRQQIEPAFAFGHGLSYTQFAFSELTLARNKLEAGEDVELTLSVKNVGERAGAEVVQAYLGGLEPSLPKAVRELKAFCKVRLEPGESKRVELSIPGHELRHFNLDADCWEYDPGRYQVAVGSSSRNLPLEATFSLKA